MDQCFKKADKLKSHSQIQSLFSEGRAFKKYPIKLIYHADSSLKRHQVGVSVPKRNFKKAVDRNRLKRQMREAYRLQQEIIKDLPDYYCLMFIYTAREKKNFDCIFTNLEHLLRELNKINNS